MKILRNLVSLLFQRHSFKLFVSYCLLLISILWLAFTVPSKNAVTAAQNPHESSDGIWQAIEPNAAQHIRKAADIPAQARTVKLNAEMLNLTLANAPESDGRSLEKSGAVMSLPLPDGKFVRVRFASSSVLEPSLAQRYPEIKSFRAIGANDPDISARFDWTPLGFHALVLANGRAHTILPINETDVTTYAVLDAGSAAELSKDFTCEVFELPEQEAQTLRQARMAALQTNVGASLRTFRLALAASWEYTNTFGGGTVAGTVASFNTWLNSINAIYERELSLRLVLVDDADIIYSTDRGFNASNDPFSNGSTVTMLGQVRPVLRDRVGAANFDIGHALGTGGGGVAYLGVVCNNGNISNDGRGPAKGGAVSLVSGSLGNHAGINVMSHEMGHQFGAYHSFNSGVGSCGSNRSSNSAVEPGSGITIMSYAGLCGTENLAAQSELRFHAISFAQITNYLTSYAGCATLTSTGNTPPSVDGGADYIIPKQTPFELTATGSDAEDGGQLTFAWDETDIAYGFSNPAYQDTNDGANSTRPLFRSYTPTAAAARVFPKLDYILYNANKPPETINGYRTAEFLPSVARTLNFTVVARDQRGGVTDDQVRLTINADAGPFLVTAPNTATTWSGAAPQTITWNVNGTNLAPISCANVRITLSTDGGASFPYVLAASTPNDGSESVTLPAGVASSVARVKVQAVGNIFFDISDANFTIEAGGSTSTPCPTVSGVNPTAAQAGNTITITGANLSNVTAVKFANNQSAQFTINSATQITATVPASAVSGAITLSQANCVEVQTAVITIGAPPPSCAVITINPSSLPNGMLNTAYSQTLTQSGVTAPVSWNVTAGALPNGLSLSAAGVLAGTPTQSGSFNFTVRVSGGDGCAETKSYSLTIAACPAGGCANTATGTLSANPNPIQVCDGTGLGVTTLTWATTGVSSVQIRLGSETGEVIYQGTAVNATGETGKWVTNGMTFHLINAANGVTLASTTVTVTSAGCTTSGNATTFTIDPNPIVVCDGTGIGVATLTWATTVTNAVIIRRGSAVGQIVALGRGRGQIRTGKWVTDGMRFYLLRQSDGALLATVAARVTATGCALAANESGHSFFVSESRSLNARGAIVRRR